MSYIGKFKKAFLSILYSESAVIFGMSITPSIIRNTNAEVKASLGDPSGIGFGWGIIFGGWTLYAPIFLIILGLLVLYTMSIIFRISYLKAYLNIPMDENRYMFLLVFSWIVYSFVPILILSGFFTSNVIIVSILLVILDILMLYFIYSKLSKIDS